MSKPNASGFRGVSLYKRTGKWRATISIDHKQRTLGYFHTPEAASAAYQAAAEERGAIKPGHAPRRQWPATHPIAKAARIMAAIKLEELYGELNTERLAEIFEVSRRTAQRDVAQSIRARQELHRLLERAEEILSMDAAADIG
jgi:hypothetical protein